MKFPRLSDYEAVEAEFACRRRASTMMSRGRFLAQGRAFRYFLKFREGDHATTIAAPVRCLGLKFRSQGGRHRLFQCARCAIIAKHEAAAY